jgi:hypothetical protein
MMLKQQDWTLRKYLLGELSETEQETVELWLMSGEESYDVLAAAEDDLIDEFIGGKLSPRELDRFNNHFLVAPERKRKVQFGQALHRYVGENSVVAPRVSIPPFSFRDLLRYRPVFAYASCALMVLILGLGFWTGFQFQDMRRQLNERELQFAAEREDLRKQLDRSVALEQQLQSNFRELEQAVTNIKLSPSPGSPGLLVAVALMPGATRAPKEIGVVDLRSNPQVAELSLKLIDDNNYESYHAVLVDDEGKELWSLDGLPAKSIRDEKVVVFVVPTRRLASGEFRVRLSGRSAANPAEKIDDYLFRVTP